MRPLALANRLRQRHFEAKRTASRERQRRRRRWQSREVVPEAGGAIGVISVALIAVHRHRHEPVRGANDKHERG